MIVRVLIVSRGIGLFSNATSALPNPPVRIAKYVYGFHPHTMAFIHGT